jgi:hypothetical protein
MSEADKGYMAAMQTMGQSMMNMKMTGDPSADFMRMMIPLYLFVWHGEHVAALLPFAVILLCPLSHLFLHRHGSGRLHNQERKNGEHLTKSAEK